MSKAIILSRVSTAMQELESQTDKVKKEALQDFKEEDLIIIENKESAVKKSEEELLGITEMKRFIEQGDISCVYCYELSRLSRRPKVLYSLRDYFIENNVQLIVINPYFRLLNEDNSINESSNIIFALYSTFAEQEARQLKERTKRGKAKAKAKGKFIGGKDLFGYCHDKDKNFHIKEDEAKVVREIFSLYCSGYSKLKIAEIMRKRGLFLNFQNAVDCHTHINDILHNESYTGKNGKPQIISQKLFDESQKMFPIKKRREKTVRLALGRSFLLNPFCPIRRKYFYVNTQIGSYFSYCNKEKTERFFIKISIVDNLIWHQVKISYPERALNSPDSHEKSKMILDIGNKIKALKSEICDINDSIQKIEERIVFGKLKPENGEKIETKLEKQLNQKNEQLAELELNLQKIEESDNNIVNLDNLDFEQKTELVRRMFASIHLFKEKLYWWRLTFWQDFSEKTEYRIYTRHRIYYKVENGKETTVEIPEYFG